MRESNFAAEINNSIPWLSQALATPISKTKIPDNFARSSDTRFTCQKFFDIFILCRGKFVALELKLSKSISISFDSIRPIQEKKLMEIAAAGCNAYLLINFRVEFSSTEAKKRQEKNCNKTFAIPITQWMKMKEEIEAKSVKLTYLEEHAIIIPKIKLTGSKIGWNLLEILNNA